MRSCAPKQFLSLGNSHKRIIEGNGRGGVSAAKRNRMVLTESLLRCVHHEGHSSSFSEYNFPSKAWALAIGANMAEVVASKLKLLHLARIFERETDDDHGLTAPQIIGKLAELGVNVERKTLYRDIDCLRAFGYNILKYNRAPVEYGLADFQEQELLLLADAVQSSKFLTESKSRSLVEGIGKLGSKYMDENLRKQVHVEGRIKSQNESVFYNTDAIQRAISLRRKIEFRYFKYDEHKKRVTSKHGDGSEIYKETPVQLAYIAAQLSLDATAISAALLHDVVEDTPYTYENIETIFGKSVAELVDGVTKLRKIKYNTREEQQVENLRKMFLAMAKDIRVVIIKLIDRLHIELYAACKTAFNFKRNA